MSQYSYKAVNDAGETLHGQMEAASVEEVIARLQDQGHTPLEARSPRVLTKARPQASLAQEYAKGERRREEMRRELMENVLGLLGLALAVYVVALWQLDPDWAQLTHQLVTVDKPSDEPWSVWAYYAVALFGAALTPFGRVPLGAPPM